jgi:AraC-like DNA-binding protein
MKENTDVNPSVLVFIVKAYGDDDMAVEAIRSGAQEYVKTRYGKNMFQRLALPIDPGSLPGSVTLSQYHKIHQAVRFINDNYGTDIRLGNAAREAGMSHAHFSRMFKKVMGVSYQDYLNNCRITKAKDLLRMSPQSVSEIAASLGFADATGFGRIFKKLTGQTPSAYRAGSECDFCDKKA